MSETSWFGRCYRQGFQNLGGKGLTAFDARALARSWKERGAELVYMNAIHGGEILYPSGLGEMAPELEGRDLVGELTDECVRLGLRSGAYISPLEHHPFTQAHPDWRQTRTDGGFHGEKRQPPSYWGCWNSPYLEHFCELVSELFSRYPLDAVFFDGLVARQGVCHCPSCTRMFKADTGFELPRAHDLEDPAFRAYLRWKDLSMAAACRRLAAATRVVNPNVQVVSNTPAAWCNWCASHPVEFFDASEFVCVEVFPGFGDTLTAAGTLHYSDVGCMAYNTAYTRGQARGFPKVQAYSYTGEMNFNIDHNLRLEAMATAAQGGLSCVQGYRPALKEAFDYIRRCEPYLVDTRPVLWSALIASQESSNTQFVNEAVSGSFFEDIRGTFGALLDSRFPVEFVSGRDLVEAPLSPYAVVILSDVGYLSPAQAEAVRRFVRDGGGLVATAQTGLIGENGKPLAESVLADVLGVRTAAAPDWPGVGGYMQEAVPAYLEFEQEPWWGDAAQPASVPEAGPAQTAHQPWMSTGRAHRVLSPFRAVTAAEGAQVQAWLRPLAGGQTGQLPGLVESRYGKGRVIYIAPRIGEIYARYPFPVWRRLIEAALRRVAGRLPDVEVRAPQCVTVYAWEQTDAGGWVIHLVNDLDATGRPRGRMPEGRNAMYGSNPRQGSVPIENVELIVRKAGATRAELPLEGRALTATGGDGGLRIHVGRVEQHSLVVVR